MPARPAAIPDLPTAPTVADLIRHGAARFEQAGLAFGHGMDDAVDEAAALVFHALDLDHARAESAYPQRPEATGIARVLALFDERIARRVPAAYLMGRMWFAGLEFEVDPRVIVPRSPFAELIHAGFAPWIDADRVRRILDIGTGSGCIAIACAVALPHAQVDAVDVSPQALEVAARNVARHGVGDRVRLLQGDVFGPVADARYDLIVANPPYVSDAEMQALPPEYLHEPDACAARGCRRPRRRAAHPRGRAAAPASRVARCSSRSATATNACSRRFLELPLTWLEFEQGGGGVFMLRADAGRQ